jgi:hypothetical protein
MSARHHGGDVVRHRLPPLVNSITCPPAGPSTDRHRQNGWGTMRGSTSSREKPTAAVARLPADRLHDQSSQRRSQPQNWNLIRTRPGTRGWRSGSPFAAPGPTVCREPEAQNQIRQNVRGSSVFCAMPKAPLEKNEPKLTGGSPQNKSVALEIPVNPPLPQFISSPCYSSAHFEKTSTSLVVLASKRLPFRKPRFISNLISRVR